MKKLRVYLPLLVFSVALAGSLSSCGRKSGCAAAYQSTHKKVGKDGKPKGKASSQLFDRKTQKKMN